jgi:hypothetical protein
MLSNKTFSAVVYTGNEADGNKGFIKYRKISSKEKFLSFVRGKFPAWRFVNIYKDKKYYTTIKRAALQ